MILLDVSVCAENCSHLNKRRKKPFLTLYKIQNVKSSFLSKSKSDYILFLVYKLSMIPSDNPIVGTVIPVAFTKFAISRNIPAAGTITSARSGFNLNCLIRS